MKSFKLQALLDYRKRQADRAHQMLTESMEKKSRIQRDKHRAEQEIAQLKGELEKERSGKVTVSELILHEQCITARKRSIRKLEEKLAGAEKKVEERRRELVKARQKKRALEILKEKSRDEQKKRLKRMEEVFLDEVAVTGYGGAK